MKLLKKYLDDGIYGYILRLQLKNRAHLIKVEKKQKN